MRQSGDQIEMQINFTAIHQPADIVCQQREILFAHYRNVGWFVCGLNADFKPEIIFRNIVIEEINHRLIQ